MSRWDDREPRGLDALRRAVAEVLLAAVPSPAFAPAGLPGPQHLRREGSRGLWITLTELVQPPLAATVDGGDGPRLGTGLAAGGGSDDSAFAASSEVDEAAGTRLIALVELARGGDTEAFGMLYDHYHPQVYRFLYYRLGSQPLAEDLTSDTFFRALRSMSSFRWQGKDFGAWLMTIARNLTTDHYKSGRNRLEMTTEDMSPHDSATEGPETTVLASLTNEALMEALHQLPAEQQECLVMRFLQGMSIAETSQAMGRSEGAIKQLQLRAVRNLAKLMPEGLR